MNHFKKSLFAATLSLCAVASGTHAQAQTVFSENFDEYTVNDGLTDQTTNFTTNDPTATADGAGNQVGDLNEVVSLTDTYTGVTSNAGQLLGGVAGTPGNAAYPSTSPVTLSQNFNLTPGTTAGGYTFGLDFVVGYTAGEPLRSGYAFTLNVGSTQELSVNFATDTDFMGKPRDGATISGGTGSLTQDANTGILLNEVYHLTVTVDGTGAGTVSLSDTMGGTATIGTFTNATALGIDSYSIEQTSPGTPSATNFAPDEVAFDNVALAVPEPSTYAMMGLGLLGLIGMMKFRRRSIN